jgi:two-component system OmpR family sensor kinase
MQERREPASPPSTLHPPPSAGLSIRLRLTLWYTAVMAVTLIGGSVALYVVLAFNVLQPAQDQLLASKGNPLAAGRAIRASAPSPPADASRRFPLPQILNNLAEGDVLIAVRDADGQVVERSSNLENTDLPLSEQALAEAHDGRPLYEDVAVEGTRLRLYTTPVVASGQTIGFVQVARSTRQVEETLAGLRDALLVGNTGLVLVAAVVGWFLARRSLEPVRRIARTAKEIESSGHLDRRVAYQGPRDDLGELAVAFNNMLDRLEATFSAQRRFVADASHELRTPLTTLRVNVELLRKDQARLKQAPPVWNEVLDDLALELERMTRMAEGLLELARADTGQHLELRPVELDPLLERVERQATQLATDVSVTLNGPPAGRIIGNADALTQLFLILVDNAIKYTPSGGKVALHRQRVDGFVHVKVVDNGAGIAPDVLPRLFDRFYRAPNVRGRSGTGLGLPIARWIAEEHDGRLAVESAPGQGSAFTVSLPVQPDARRNS